MPAFSHFPGIPTGKFASLPENNPLRDTPYGDWPTDSDYTIGEVKTIDGDSIYGVIWYAGGESWSWSDYKAALASARDTAARQEVARRKRAAIKA